MKNLPPDRAACLRALLGNFLGDRVAALTAAEQVRLATDDGHPLAAELGRTNRQRLGAAVRLAQILRSEPWAEPSRIWAADDVACLILPRCRSLDERAVWLLCLDEASCVEHEVLVQAGGDPATPAPVRVLLRHALIKGAHAVWVADFRPRWSAVADEATERSLAAAAEAGALAGVEVRGWLLFGRDGALSVDSRASGGPAICVAA